MNSERSKLLPADYTRILFRGPQHTTVSTLFTFLGVKKIDAQGEHYVLTDPAVHSVDELFGLTDLGVAGVYRMLFNHTCTDLCKNLGLTNPVRAM